MSRQSGQAVAEWAIVMTMTMPLLLGMAELGVAGLLTYRMQNSAAAVAVRPDLAEQERLRLGCDGTVTITEADGLRLVAMRCANPLPFTHYLTSDLYAEAVAPIEEAP